MNYNIFTILLCYQNLAPVMPARLSVHNSELRESEKKNRIVVCRYNEFKRKTQLSFYRLTNTQ